MHVVVRDHDDRDPPLSPQPRDATLLEALRARVPDARVVVYSGYVGLMPNGALGAAADAYVAKDDDETELIATIRRVFSSR